MKLVKWLDKHLEEILLVALLFVMMIIMGIQILARYALGNSLSWSEEITRFCFIWTGFLSISYCIKNSKSIKIEQFVEWFKDDFGGMGVHVLRLVSYIPQLCVFDTPCVYTDIKTFRQNMENEDLLDEFREIYREHGYRFLGITDQGFRVMTMSQPYTDLSSIAGQKIRVMENKYHIQFWKSVNANPTPMTFSEVYIGLQQGTIDAQENALPLIVTAKLYEQQKRLIMTNAVPDLVTLIASGKFMDSLTEEQAAIIEEAARLAQEDAKDISDHKTEEAIKYLEEAGMEIVTPSQKDYEDMRQMCQPVWDSIREDCGAELFDEYTSIAEE